MAFLLGRLNLRTSPPTLDRIDIMSSPAGSMGSYGPERWIDLIPVHTTKSAKDFQEGFDRICNLLIEMQEYFRWMEPLLDQCIINRCLALQGIDSEVGLAIHEMRFEPGWLSKKE